jgi:hypothetical protein
MTPTPTTDSAVSPVSVEEIEAIILATEPDVPACVDGSTIWTKRMAVALHAALSRRSLDTADGVETFMAHVENIGGGYGANLRPHPEGRWVRLSDYQALASRTPNTEMVDEEDLASDDRWNAGVNYAIERLCEILGVDPKAISWDAATETVDGDVMSVICNVLVAAYGEEWSSNERETTIIRSALASPPSPAEVTTRDAIYILEWIAAPRPPTHPAEMNGVQSFPSMEAAVRFFARSPDDTQFVSISERATVSSDKSDEFRALLEALQLNKKG